ncbi:MAG: hypothetical protein ABJA81_08305 [Nocardioidaceae bacterium]
MSTYHPSKYSADNEGGWLPAFPTRAYCPNDSQPGERERHFYGIGFQILDGTLGSLATVNPAVLAAARISSAADVRK